MLRLLFILFAALMLAEDSANPWAKSDIVEPAALAAELKTPQRPMIISVAFPVLYRNRHILGAVDANAGLLQEGGDDPARALLLEPKLRVGVEVLAKVPQEW